MALAALALVVFGAYDSYPTLHTPLLSRSDKVSVKSYSEKCTCKIASFLQPENATRYQWGSMRKIVSARTPVCSARRNSHHSPSKQDVIGALQTPLNKNRLCLFLNYLLALLSRRIRPTKTSLLTKAPAPPMRLSIKALSHSCNLDPMLPHLLSLSAVNSKTIKDNL